jgi:hypothetical protein
MGVLLPNNRHNYPDEPDGFGPRTEVAECN